VWAAASAPTHPADPTGASRTSAPRPAPGLPGRRSLSSSTRGSRRVLGGFAQASAHPSRRQHPHLAVTHPDTQRRRNHRRGGQDVAATESTRSSAGWPVPHPRRSPRRPPTPRRGSHVPGDADPSGPARRAVKRKIVRRWASHGFAPSPTARSTAATCRVRSATWSEPRGTCSGFRQSVQGSRSRPKGSTTSTTSTTGTSGRSGWTDSTSAAVSPINASAAQRRSRPRSEERQCRGNGGRCAGPWDRRPHVGDSIHIRAALPGRWAARIAHCPSGSPPAARDSPAPG
jgi:hypothetical protein